MADAAVWLRRRRRTEGKLIVLMYHAITDSLEPDPAQLTVSKRLFADQMRWLKELGYPVVPLPVAAAQLRARTLGSPVVALTFDDGYRSVYTHALPILASHGYPATVFLVSGAQRGVSLPDFMPARLGLLLSWSEAREMLRHGISFGAHGVTHRKLAGLPDHEAAHEVGDSKREIEDALSTMVTEFCYPFGSFDSFTDSVEAIVRGFGFTAVCANIAGHNTRPGDADRLKRLRVSWVDDSMREIGKQCLGAYNWYALYQRARDLWCGGRP